MEFYKPSSYVRLWIINLTHEAEEDIHFSERRNIRVDEQTQHVIVDIKNICDPATIYLQTVINDLKFFRL